MAEQHRMIDLLSRANVFDESFKPFSYFADEQQRLQGIELALKTDNGAERAKSYVLSVETVGRHMARVAIDASEAEESDAQTYLISADEILPNDILILKTRSLEELEPYLLEQEPDVEAVE